MEQKKGMALIKGVIIASINLNSAAAEVGLKKDDILVSIDDQMIEGTSSFYEIINQYRPGDKVDIQYVRRGALEKKEVILRNYLNTTDFLSVRSDKELKDIGIEIRDLHSLEKARLKTEGVMILSIARGSTIAKTNMEPGYVVELLNNVPVSNAKEFISLLKSSKGQITLMGFYERYPGKFPYTFEANQ